MGEGKNKTFSKAFKEEAVRLMEQSGRPAAEIAREIGIPRNRLYKWQERIRANGVDAFPGSGRLSGESEQLRRLKRELERVREERDILKKATVSSTDHRNTFLKFICWRTEIQRFSRPLIQTQSNLIEFSLCVKRQICAFWKILPQ